MSTPGRRTRSKRGTPDPPISTSRGVAPSLAPSTASDIGQAAATPRRSARLASPEKDGAPQSLPPIGSRTGTAYGSDGRGNIPDNMQNDPNLAEALDALRDVSSQDANVQRAPGPDQGDVGTSSRRGGSRSRQSSAAPSDRLEAESALTRNRRGRMQNLDAIEEVPTPRAERQQSNYTLLSRLRATRNRLSPTRTTTNTANAENTSLLGDGAAYAGTEDVASSASSPDSPATSVITDLSTINALVGRFDDGYSCFITAVSGAYENMPRVTSHLIKKLLFAILPILLCVTLWKVYQVPSPTDAPPALTLSDPISAFKHYSDVAWTSFASWRKGSPVAGMYQYPWALDNRVQSLDGRVKELEKQVESLTASRTLHADSIKKLQEVLPNLIVTRVKGGVVQFPDGLVEALKERLDPFYSEKDPIPSWDAFMSINARELEKFTHASADATFEDAYTTKRLISFDELTGMLNEHFSAVSEEAYAKISNELEEKWARFNWTKSDSTVDVIHRSVRSELRLHLPSDEVYKLSYVRIAQNHEMLRGSFNYFSPRAGAMVDPTLSSPTMKRPISAWHAVYARVKGIRTANPPIAALEPWEEAGDCWCAAPPRNGDIDLDPDETPWQVRETEEYQRKHRHTPTYAPRAQIAVLLPHLIHVTGLTIEHIPYKATLNPRAAPRIIELWVAIDNLTTRDYMKTNSRKLWSVTESHFRRSSGRDEGVGLPVAYVLIDKWLYDMSDPNHIQSHSINDFVHRAKIETRKVVVRAVDNWGSDHTCFYRIRLHGEEIEPRECLFEDQGNCMVQGWEEDDEPRWWQFWKES